jgi:hypothetical protein
MLFHWAEYYLFKGFKKPRIKKVRVDFMQKLTILNSTNGSGKTTFLSELSPFPLEKTLFYKGGYKRIVLSNAEGTFELYSDHSKNSFINVDTKEELNGGGTIRTQLDLIERYFRLTPYLWGLITGYAKFTAGDKTARRAWMETISGLDFEEAFTIYTRIQKAISAHKGAIKINQSHLASEKTKLLSEDIVEQLAGEQQALSVLCQDIMLATPQASRNDVTTLLSREERYVRELKENYAQYLRMGMPSKPQGNYDTLAALREHGAALQGELSKLDYALQETTKQLAEKVSLRERLKRRDGFNLHHVDEQLATLKTKLESITTDASETLYEAPYSILVATQPEYREGVLRSFISAKESVLDALMQSAHSFFGYSYEDRQNHQQLVMEKEALDERLGKGRIMQERILTQLEHIRQCTRTTCPHCDHSFLVGVDATAKGEEQLAKELASVEERITLLGESRKALLDKIGIFEGRLAQQRLVKAQLQRHGEFTAIWAHLDLGSLTDAMSLSKTFDDLITAFTKQLTRLELEGKVREFEVIRTELLATANIADAGEVSEHCMALEQRLTELNSERDLRLAFLQNLKQYGTTASRKLTQLDKLVELCRGLEQTRAELVQALEYACCKELSEFGQNRLGLLTHQLNENKTLSRIVSDLEDQVSKSREKLVLLVLLEKAMNPTTGVIAEQLVDYTKAFANQNTHILAQLWGYPLTILPCEIDGSKGMDYKFPFLVGDDPDPTDDIAHGSKSQVVVFNLAIMLATRVAKGLENMPLFLDEVGEGFDTVHHENLGNFVKKLMSDYQCSNVLMVHHDETMRSLMTQYDMVVFDPSQVIVNEPHNLHCKLEYY